MSEIGIPNGALDRRDFLKSLGGGVLVLFAVAKETDAQESGGGHGRRGEDLPGDVAAWLHIAPNGTITAYTGKVEVGQNARTSLTQAVADELRCEPGTVELVMGDTARTPWDAGTFGSRTTPTMAPELRKMASTAREILIDTAANEWGVNRTDLTVTSGCIGHQSSGRKQRFGELAA
ncbi:MAG TPA: molybdopterin cofactor-binding domain-containing protein, partial [Bryobacteraceae bacterium]